jgi:hypothetical protein
LRPSEVETCLDPDEITTDPYQNLFSTLLRNLLYSRNPALLQSLLVLDDTYLLLDRTYSLLMMAPSDLVLRYSNPVDSVASQIAALYDLLSPTPSALLLH